MKKYLYLILILGLYSNQMFAQIQKRDKGEFIDKKNAAWDSIRVSVDAFEKKSVPAKKSFIVDYSNYNIPKSPDEFTKVWCNKPIQQGATGTCWSFSASSYLESEIFRINNKQIKISEIYTVYWEYVEKAKRFIAERGNSVFSEGSQGNAVTRIWELYGCMPWEIYNGLKPGQKYHNHEKMVDEMSNYLQDVKKSNAWNEKEIIETIKSIMNHYIGEPPTEFTWNGKKYTPLSFFKEEAKLNPSDYVNIYSLMESEFWKKAMYDVPDNWWRSGEYYNIPLVDWIKTLKSVLKAGYSVALAGDVSESGMYSYADAAVVPSYDIPSEYIDDYARQFRFSNGTTTDDHGIHLIGYKEDGPKWWFLIKDSGSGAQNGNAKGYYYFNEDYVKLKMLYFIVHKDAVKEIISKFK